jgi:hypothetical protein
VRETISVLQESAGVLLPVKLMATVQSALSIEPQWVCLAPPDYTAEVTVRGPAEYLCDLVASTSEPSIAVQLRPSAGSPSVRMQLIALPPSDEARRFSIVVSHDRHDRKYQAILDGVSVNPVKAETGWPGSAMTIVQPQSEQAETRRQILWAGTGSAELVGLDLSPATPGIRAVVQRVEDHSVSVEVSVRWQELELGVHEFRIRLPCESHGSAGLRVFVRGARG